MHFNENAKRRPAITKEGKGQYKVWYPKYKNGQHSVKTIRTDMTFRYVQILMDEVIERGQMKLKDASTVSTPVPPPLTHSFVKPDKNLAVEQLLSRFRKSDKAIKGLDK